MIELIAAIGKNREIGIDGELPWHLSSDLKRFKSLTDGQTVIMGLNTFNSLGRALSNRINIVLCAGSDPDLPEEVIKAGSIEEALGRSPKDRRIFVIGGAMVYSAALPIAEVMHITFVDKSISGADAHFPSWNLADWKVVSVLPCPPSGKDGDDQVFSTYVVYERRK